MRIMNDGGGRGSSGGGGGGGGGGGSGVDSIAIRSSGVDGLRNSGGSTA
jgi:hypothetical protein